jgi:hypothetical protein
MTMRFFATPEDAEAVFYDALERADLDAMMAIWAEDEEVICTHPYGERVAGCCVRESWRQVFQRPARQCASKRRCRQHPARPAACMSTIGSRRGARCARRSSPALFTCAARRMAPAVAPCLSAPAAAAADISATLH